MGRLTWSVGSASLQTAWLLQTGSRLLKNGLCPEQSCTRSSVCLVCGRCGGGWEEKREGRRRAERRDAGRMEGKERRGIGKGGACLCWDGGPQGCLHWGTPTLVPSLTILSASWMVEPPPCWPRAREISRWISSDLHKDWPPATDPGQTPKPGCNLGLSTRLA